jgi:hypothetical protein
MDDNIEVKLASMVASIGLRQSCRPPEFRDVCASQAAVMQACCNKRAGYAEPPERGEVGRIAHAPGGVD